MSPAPFKSIHLVLGESAAGCVQAACASFGMPGAVVRFSGDLAHCPLDDEALCSQWRALIARLDLEQPDALIVWSADNVGDTIFVAMACDQLAGRPEPLLRVRVPAINACPNVAMHSPAKIASLYPTRQALSAAQRRSLARDFARMRDTCGALRRLEQGQVQGVGIDAYDPLLLAACTAQWQAPGHVVGSAMAHCDAPNLLGDGFFRERLGVLVDAGRIEVDNDGRLRRKAF